MSSYLYGQSEPSPGFLENIDPDFDLYHNGSSTPNAWSEINTVSYDDGPQYNNTLGEYEFKLNANGNTKTVYQQFNVTGFANEGWVAFADIRGNTSALAHNENGTTLLFAVRILHNDGTSQDFIYYIGGNDLPHGSTQNTNLQALPYLVRIFTGS